MSKDRESGLFKFRAGGARWQMKKKIKEKSV